MSGLSDRMLVESVTQAIVTQLTTLGWFGGSRQHSPISVVPVFPKGGEEPDKNTLTVELGSFIGNLAEMGSTAEDRYTVLEIHFWGESRSLTLELLGDIWAFLRTNPVLPVYDYAAVGNPVDFYIALEEDSMRLDHPNVNRSYEKNWAYIVVGYWDFRSYG